MMDLGEPLPERGTFFKLEVYKRVGVQHLNYRKWLEKLPFRY